MTDEILLSEARVFQPGWNHAFKIWWWWVWRTMFCSFVGGVAWAFLAMAVFPMDVREIAVIGGGYIWGLASSIFFLKRLFTHGRFCDFAPTLIKG